MRKITIIASLAAVGAGALLAGQFTETERTPTTAAPEAEKKAIPAKPQADPSKAMSALVRHLPSARVATPSANVPRDAASSERFRSSQTCYLNQKGLESLKNVLLNCESMAGIEEVAESYKMCSSETENRMEQIKELEGKTKSCEKNVGKLSQDYYRATKEAAAAGDQNAQLCYTQGNFGDGVRLPPEEIQDYTSRATDYARLAFMRGDWRIVRLFKDSGYQHSGFLQLIAPADAGTRYRMNRLLRLGARGDYARRLDREAESSFAARDLEGNLNLPPAEVAAAERWAREVHAKYFKSSPALSEKPPPACVQSAR